VFDCCMLLLELTDGVFGMARVHGLRDEDVDLEEVAGHQLLKSVLIPSPLHLARFHQISFLMIFTVIPLI